MDLNLVVADDHPVVRVGIRSAATKCGIGRVVAEASSVAQLIDILDSHPCNVLLTDLFIPGGGLPGGIRVLPFLLERYPYLPIVVMTASMNIGLIRLLARLGVVSFISKADPLCDLYAAVDYARRRQHYLGRTLLMRSRRFEVGCHWPWSRVDLSVNEMNVVTRLAAGLTLSEISRANGHRLNTVSRQKQVAMRKLAVANEVELVEVIRSGLLGRTTPPTHIRWC
jgi:two-component system capsular synthesis response regulator RcsB